MILTVTLNAAMDRTLVVPNFAGGFRHRATDTYAMPGGKGVNVARTIKTLGQPVIATGLAGGGTGDRIVADLNREGILCDFVATQAESRTSTAVLDPTAGVATEINEYGPWITSEELNLMQEKLDYLAKAADLVVLAGSLPRGLPTDIYATLTRGFQRRGLQVFLDTAGEPLRQGIKAGPDVVFPNQVEAEMVVGHEFSGDDDYLRGVSDLVQLGAKGVVITRKEGCAAQIGRGEDPSRFLGRTVEVESVSSIGSGDALVGGFAVGVIEGRSDLESLRLGLACAAANTLDYGAGSLDAKMVERFVDKVEVDEVRE